MASALAIACKEQRAVCPEAVATLSRSTSKEEHFRAAAASLNRAMNLRPRGGLTSMDASTRIDDPSLQLPRPFVRALITNGILTFGAASAKSDSDLLTLHGVGPKGIPMLRELQRESA
jgi:hypothetical protein